MIYTVPSSSMYANNNPHLDSQNSEKNYTLKRCRWGSTKNNTWMKNS